MNDASCDIRMYSLLHALGDEEEVIKEAIRLLLEPEMNEMSWQQIRDMGRDVAPGHALFDSSRTFRQLRSEYARYYRARENSVVYREIKRRKALRNTDSDRRSGERRRVSLSWLGADRRKRERRRIDA